MLGDFSVVVPIERPRCGALQRCCQRGRQVILQQIEINGHLPDPSVRPGSISLIGASQAKPLTEGMPMLHALHGNLVTEVLHSCAFVHSLHHK